MEQKGLVKASMNLPGFVQNAYESVEAMEKFSQLLLDSKLCPDHFYEKTQDDKGKTVPDYTKGKTAAVMMVLLQGHQLNLPPLTALQHVIPVNGLLSIKGDAAKTLIFNSGKLEPGTWKETVSGSLSDGTYECTITAKRSDTQEEMSRTFSVTHAKRAGLWIDEAKIRGQDGWKYQKSAWYKYPERMIAYRALGFLARDLFPDVLSGIYTTEEAIDMPVDTTTIVPTESGADIVIPDKEFNQSRSGSLTKKAAEAIDKRNGPVDPPPPPASDDVMPDDHQVKQSHIQHEDEGEDEVKRESIPTMLNGTVGFIPVYNEDELKEMDALTELNPLIEHDSLMVKARDVDPGKNTNKKLRNIILTHYAGDVVNLIAKFDQEFQDPLAGKVPDPPDPEVEQEDADMEQQEYEAVVQDEMAEDEHGSDNIEPNTEFDATAPDDDPQVEGNQFDIVIPDLVDGKRSFDEVKTLYEELANKAGVDNNAYDTLVKTKFPQFQKYRVKEDFCYMAETSEINLLLNSI